jgi:hypothetical protein
VRRAQGGALLATFQNGLVEQGATAAPLTLPAPPYLRDLAAAARAASSASSTARAQRALLSPDRMRLLSDDQARHASRVRCCAC